MSIFKKIFKKNDENSKLVIKYKPLQVPELKQNLGRQIPAGQYKLVTKIADIQQARPPRKSQLWQGLDVKGKSCSIAIFEPGEENKEWVVERLGCIKIKKIKVVAAQGALRRLGKQIGIIVFDTIFGQRYLLKEKIVSDGMQETYYGWDTKEKKAVICTLVIPEKQISVDKFIKRSAKPKEKLYKGILPLLDEGAERPSGIFASHRFKANKIYYAITQHAPVVNFSHFVSKWKRKISVEDIFFILKELEKMLDSLSSFGKVHGNIRPETLFISTAPESKGELLLNGFSIIDPEKDQNTTSFSIVRNDINSGFPAYMAPEQIRYKNVTQKIDIFCVGILLYHLIEGKSPFKSKKKRESIELLSSWKNKVKLSDNYIWLTNFLASLMDHSISQRREKLDAWAGELNEAYNNWMFQDSEDIIESSIKEKEKKTEKEKKEKNIKKQGKEKTKAKEDIKAKEVKNLKNEEFFEEEDFEDIIETESQQKESKQEEVPQEKKGENQNKGAFGFIRGLMKSKKTKSEIEEKQEFEKIDDGEKSDKSNQKIDKEEIKEELDDANSFKSNQKIDKEEIKEELDDANSFEESFEEFFEEEDDTDDFIEEAIETPVKKEEPDIEELTNEELDDLAIQKEQLEEEDFDEDDFEDFDTGENFEDLDESKIGTGVSKQKVMPALSQNKNMKVISTKIEPENQLSSAETFIGELQEKEKLDLASFDEEEDFEWETEFELVNNSLSQWDETGEEEIVQIEGSEVTENSKKKKKKEK